MERREKAEETWAKDRLSTCDEEEKEDCERGCREACYIQMQNAPLERGGGSGWCHGPGAWKLWSPCVYECECTLHLVSPYDRNEDQCLCKVRASGSVRSAFCFRSSTQRICAGFDRTSVYCAAFLLDHLTTETPPPVAGSVKAQSHACVTKSTPLATRIALPGEWRALVHSASKCAG
jgi:hypothetical protein